MNIQQSNARTNVLKVAMIGCGRISVMHFDGILRCRHAQLVACCDVVEQKAVAAAKKYGCNAYVSYQEMFKSEKIDAVHICLPHYLHAPVAQYAISLGIHVLTEKPMAISLQDAKDTVRLAKEKGVSYAVIFQCRYNAATKLVKRRAEEGKRGGKLGSLICASSVLTWSRSDEYYSHSDWKGTWDKEGGGVIIDQAIHSIDLVNYVTDAPVKRVRASMDNQGHDLVSVEDSAHGIVEYENGVKYCFYCTNNFCIDEPIEIKMIFEGGRAVFSYDAAEIVYADGTKETIANDETEQSVDGGKDYWGFRHAEQIQKFYEALLGLHPLEISGEDALKTHQLICRIYEEGKKTFKSKND